jgi:hypothetical protein
VDRSPAGVECCATYDLISRQSKDSLGTAIARSNAAVGVKDEHPSCIAAMTDR